MGEQVAAGIIKSKSESFFDKETVCGERQKHKTERIKPQEVRIKIRSVCFTSDGKAQA